MAPRLPRDVVLSLGLAADTVLDVHALPADVVEAAASRSAGLGLERGEGDEMGSL